MNVRGAVLATIVGGFLTAGAPMVAHAGDTQKGKDAKGQNACSGKNGCKGKGSDQKTDSGKKP